MYIQYLSIKKDGLDPPYEAIRLDLIVIFFQETFRILFYTFSLFLHIVLR